MLEQMLVKEVVICDFYHVNCNFYEVAIFTFTTTF